MIDFFKKIENSLIYFLFILTIILPFFEIISRYVNIFSIPANQVIVQHGTLWIGFVGAVIAARSNRLLSIVKDPIFNRSNSFKFFQYITHILSASIVLILSTSYFKIIQIGIQYPSFVFPFVTEWFVQLVIPFSLISIWFYLIYLSSSNSKYRLSVFILSIIITLLTYFIPFPTSNIYIFLVLFILLILAVWNGLPIFITLGGFSIIFYLSIPTDWSTNFEILSSISDGAYRIVSSPTISAIPLFTLGGYILSKSNVSSRLFNFFKSAFGWFSGSTILIVVFISALFTSLTGGSGVTIIALGGVLYPILINEGYSKKFTLGVLTSCGSLGLLFPPSLPSIIYSISAGVNPINFFKIAFFPAIILIFSVIFYGFFKKPTKSSTVNFNYKNFLQCLKIAKWELLIPVIIIVSIFSGFSTLVESASLLVVYIILIELFIYKDLTILDLKKVTVEASKLIGGVLIILGFAMGLTGYLVDAQIPLKILNFARDFIASPLVFLLALNILLLLAGSLMDIFSAILVIVPLILPLSTYYGIDPIHLGIIFISNLELGYITPPVGMNLFLSSYRFDKSLSQVLRSSFPFFLIRLIGLLFITYIPLFFY